MVNLSQGHRKFPSTKREFSRLECWIGRDRIRRIIMGMGMAVL
jgi:hypothetical protein